MRVRDQVDVRDLIEALVPFAKTINGLSRRVTGFVCGALGTYAMRCLPGGRQLEELREPVELRQGGKGLDEKAFRIDTVVEVDPPFLSPADIPRKFPSPSSSHMPSTRVDLTRSISFRTGIQLWPSQSTRRRCRDRCRRQRRTPLPFRIVPPSFHFSSRLDRV